MDDAAPEPCPFCGGAARTFRYDGALQATCAATYQDCAGADLHAPVAMWNKRPRKPAPIAYLRTYPRDGSRFLAFAAMTGELPEVQKLDNGTIIQNTPLFG